MKTKRKVPTKFYLFKSWAENQSGYKLKILWADRDRKYISINFEEELKKIGIKWQSQSLYV